jgi:hypothetical protein
MLPLLVAISALKYLESLKRPIDMLDHNAIPRKVPVEPLLQFRQFPFARLLLGKRTEIMQCAKTLVTLVRNKQNIRMNQKTATLE